MLKLIFNNLINCSFYNSKYVNMSQITKVKNIKFINLFYQNSNRFRKERYENKNSVQI